MDTIGLKYNLLRCLHITRLLLCGLVLFLMASSIGAEVVITIADFSVESDETKYAYIGKGISSLIAGELRLSISIKLLEREQLNEIIEEQNLSLSGLFDDDQQVEIGKLLSADYIIFGEIIDMASAFLISARITDVNTGEVIWTDSIMEKLEKYDYIGAFFAQAILTELNADIKPETIVKVEEQNQKDSEALVALSQGIDAYDKGDDEKAKEELSIARRIDPENEIAKFYLSKLSTFSPKYRTDIVEYLTPYSAASLSLQENMKLYSWGGLTIQAPWIEELPDSEIQPIGDFGVIDRQSSFFFGVSALVGKSLGIGGGFTLSQQETFINHQTIPDYFNYEVTQGNNFNSKYTNIGGYLSIGYNLLQWLNVGTSFMIWKTTNDYHPGRSDEFVDGEIVHEGVFFSIYPGVILIPFDSKTLFEINFAYTNQKVYSVDLSGEILLSCLPMVIDSSFVYGPVVNKLFFGIKAISEIYYDIRVGHTLRLVPTIEYWPFELLTIRVGYEYSHFNIDDSFSMGHGFMVGLSLNPGKFRIHTNLTYRERPIRNMPQASIPDFKLLIGIEFDTGLLSRKK